MSARELLLLDTSIVVHIFRGGAVGQRVDRAYGLRERPERPLISVVTVGEVLGFGRQRDWADKKMAALRRLLTELVVVDINHAAVLECYADLRGRDRKGGWNLSQNDTWIAATAVATGSLLLTTDRDFERVDQTILRSVYIDPVATEGAGPTSS